REVPPPPNQLERARDNVTAVTTGLSSHLLQLSLIQAAARLESVTLRPVQIAFQDAYRLAEANRLDWMNARAGLVDSWRQIAVDAEALKNGLNLIVNGDVPTAGNSAFNFDEDGGRIQVGLEIDTPITKLGERNNYRETLISYQRARRDYIQFEDQISQSLRNSLRIVRLSQLNFEVRRAAVRVAIAQVDLARLRLNEPPKPGQGGAQFGATTARDLVSALGDLLDAQNDFLSVWVSFEVLRMLLDYELGSMQLDDAGLWIDPERMTAESLLSAPVNNAPQTIAESEEPAAEVNDVTEEPKSERKRGFFSFLRRN
ncbi:MAG: TolC family protein, partial [Verrucomicrobiota bacterium]